MQIEADSPIVPITLKLTINQRNDPIITTLPIADLTRPVRVSQLIFPQVGFGGGLATRLIFIGALQNGEGVQSGGLRLVQSDGSPLEIFLPDGLASQTDYQVPASGSLQIRPGNLAQPAQIILDSSSPGAAEFVVNEGNSRSLQPIAIDENGELRDDFRFEYFNLDDQTAEVAGGGEIAGMERGFSTLVVTVGGA